MPLIDPELHRTAQLMYVGADLVEHLIGRGEHMLWETRLREKFPHRSIPIPTLKRYIETFASSRNIPPEELRQIIQCFGDEIGQVELNNGQSTLERLEDLKSFVD